MRLFGIVFASLLTGACAHHLSADDKVAANIERLASLPKGALPIVRYSRHYAWSSRRKGVVEAVYDSEGKPGRIWLPWDEMPIILDGGCSVVTFSFDSATKSFERMRCN